MLSHDSKLKTCRNYPKYDVVASDSGLEMIRPDERQVSIQGRDLPDKSVDGPLKRSRKRRTKIRG